MEKGYNILLVDDEPGVREATQAVLRWVGKHIVTSCSSGTEALAEFVPGRFDLVITDLRMAGMDGIELAERLRQLAPDQPIMLLTAFCDEVPSCVDLLHTKPFSLAGLLAAVEKTVLLGRARAIRQPTPSACCVQDKPV